MTKLLRSAMALLATCLLAAATEYDVPAGMGVAMQQNGNGYADVLYQDRSFVVQQGSLLYPATIGEDGVLNFSFDDAYVSYPATEGMTFVVAVADGTWHRLDVIEVCCDSTRVSASMVRLISDEPETPGLPYEPEVPHHHDVVDTVRLSGSWYRGSGGELDKITFNEDGTFTRLYIGAAALGYLRRSERGTFEVSGGTLTLRTSSTATGANGYGGGFGGQDDNVTVEQLTFEASVSSIFLNGVEYKPSNW